MDHFEYRANLMGIGHVALGPDTFFGDHVCLHTADAAALDAGEEPEHQEVEYVEGLENPSEFPNVIRWLVAHGYSDEDVNACLTGRWRVSARSPRLVKP